MHACNIMHEVKIQMFHTLHNSFAEAFIRFS